MIASPCHHGKVDNVFTLSLIQSLYILDHNSIQTVVLLPATGSILAKERNKIIKAFIDSDCTHLLMIDSDIGWPASTPFNFLNLNKDIVAGIYPARCNTSHENKFIFLPDLASDGSIITNKSKTLLKILRAPAGFMMVTKDAILKMQEKHHDLKYEGIDINGNKEEGFVLFNTELKDGKFWGEDYVFCRNAIEAGINIWCDPTITFNHSGFIGCLSDVLTEIPPIKNGKFEYSSK